MKRISKYLLGLALITTAFSAKAGSYQLNDYSVTGLGRAYAGQGIMGDDYSAIAYNPAGMTLMKRSGVQTGLTMINLRADVDGIDKWDGNHKKMDFWAPIPHAFGQVNVNDKWSIGLGVYAPFGLKTQYDADWYGSDTAILSKLDIIDINLSTAYKLTEKWSVGVGFIARYIYGHMTNSLSSAVGGGESDFELDGWTKTGILGVMYEPVKDTRFGLSYRLRSTQQVKGDHEIKGNKGITTYIPGIGPYQYKDSYDETATGWASPALPETLTFSAYHRYKDLGFSGTARWTHWSQSFKKFGMRSDSRLFNDLSSDPLMASSGAATGITDSEKTSYYRYHNSWTLTAGLDWYYNQKWTFRCGTGWDQSPSRNAENRTVRIPDNNRYWLSAGASYATGNWQWDVGYTHMFGRTGEAYEVSDKNATHVKYKKLQSYLLGAQMQYKF